MSNIYSFLTIISPIKRLLVLKPLNRDTARPMSPRSKPLNLLFPWRVWLAVILFPLPSMVVIIALPGRDRRRRAAHWSARPLFRLLGVGFRVQGLEHLPRACI